jgi:S1-C subfamily serine protease
MKGKSHERNDTAPRVAATAVTANDEEFPGPSAGHYLPARGLLLVHRLRQEFHVPWSPAADAERDAIFLVAVTPYGSERRPGVYKRVLPGVVNITSTSLAFNFFLGTVPQEGQGSGFIVDTAGHILTNYHVVEGGRDIEVTIGKRKPYKAQVVLKDKADDLALLQVNAPDLQPVVLADSKNLQVGQKVYAIGNPFGLSGTMTTGIISAMRSVRGPEGNLIENAIQTDAAINPGNSGGPLLNLHGEVIGINSMIATNPNEQIEQNAGIGFAIPINTAKAVLKDFAQYGRVRRPSLGIVSALPIGPDLAQQMGLAADSGVLVERTLQGGPAANAGLRGGSEQAYLGNTPIYLGGDLIVAIAGQSVTNPQEINDVLNQHRAGDTVEVTFYRGKVKRTVSVTLGEAGSAPEQQT